ncbi:hypothetical protein HCH52_00270 [Oscillospiraceae bacterium HV4-5-C5C]|nr:hypothetical protein [Oscillospiraceae bacterium HV4-5-C5C]
METMIRRQYEHPGKRYLPVKVLYDCNGVMTPQSFQWAGQEILVDRVLAVRREASQIAGAAGIRYVCRVLGRQLSLWYEDGRWFVEQHLAPTHTAYTS